MYQSQFFGHGRFETFNNEICYNPQINFCAILFDVMWCKSPDSYHAKTPPALIFVLRLLPLKRNKTSVKEDSTFHLYYFTGKNKLAS